MIASHYVIIYEIHFDSIIGVFFMQRIIY